MMHHERVSNLARDLLNLVPEVTLYLRKDKVLHASMHCTNDVADVLKQTTLKDAVRGPRTRVCWAGPCTDVLDEEGYHTIRRHHEDLLELESSMKDESRMAEANDLGWVIDDLDTEHSDGATCTVLKDYLPPALRYLHDQAISIRGRMATSHWQDELLKELLADDPDNASRHGQLRRSGLGDDPAQLGLLVGDRVKEGAWGRSRHWGLGEVLLEVLITMQDQDTQDRYAVTAPLTVLSLVLGEDVQSGEGVMGTTTKLMVCPQDMTPTLLELTKGLYDPRSTGPMGHLPNAALAARRIH